MFYNNLHLVQQVKSKSNLFWRRKNISNKAKSFHLKSDLSIDGAAEVTHHFKCSSEEVPFLRGGKTFRRWYAPYEWGVFRKVQRLNLLFYQCTSNRATRRNCKNVSDRMCDWKCSCKGISYVRLHLYIFVILLSAIHISNSNIGSLRLCVCMYTCLRVPTCSYVLAKKVMWVYVCWSK